MREKISVRSIGAALGPFGLFVMLAVVPHSANAMEIGEASPLRLTGPSTKNITVINTYGQSNQARSSAQSKLEPSRGEAICGNVLLDDGEQCDDGNVNDGDGCSSSCQVEAGFRCSDPVPASVINGVPDGGFEAGTPNPQWTEASTNFETPLCDIAACGLGQGTGPNSGGWWAWFGGIDVPEVSSVEQAVVFESTDTALTFAVENPRCDSGLDFARVLIDGNIEFAITGDDPFCGVIGYRTITIDLSAYNDGLAHTVRVEAEFFAINTGASNFFFDDFILNRGVVPPQPSVCTVEQPTCYFEDFDSAMILDTRTSGVEGTALTGWTVFNTGSLALDWGTTNDDFCGSASWVAGNYAGGNGIAACVDSDAAGAGQVNAYLCSPPVDLSSVTGATLAFEYNYQVFNNTIEDAFEVLVGTAAPGPGSVNTYTPLFFTNADAGMFQGDSASEILDISDFDGVSAVYLCYRYGGDFDWYGQVDDIEISGDSCGTVIDADGDGIADSSDNCIYVANADQYDSNGDGIGSLCDGDVIGPAGGPDDCFVNFLDLGEMNAAFFSNPSSPGWNPDLDFNNDSVVNFLDLELLKDFFLSPPGPSATGCN